MTRHTVPERATPNNAQPLSHNAGRVALFCAQIDASGLRTRRAAIGSYVGSWVARNYLVLTINK
jgi:hypothetical protein